jgi:hypothetical protein
LCTIIRVDLYPEDRGSMLIYQSAQGHKPENLNMIFHSHGNPNFNFISYKEGDGVDQVFRASIFMMFILYF